MGAIFSCRGISKYYEGAPVVRGVSLDLDSGGFVSLLGPSGVGKTTLFNALAGLDKPDSGRVLLSGEDITGVSGRVSYMPQKDLLLDYRTTLDNVILPLLIRRKRPEESRQYAASFFPRFGLSGFENKYPRQLSGGMRQRAALLRTCMMNNPVILLDEPFSALDAITRFRMQRWYKEIQAEMGLSTLFITHDVDEALLLSDRILIMNGRPGEITLRFDIASTRQAVPDFPASPEYAVFKKKILSALDLAI
ncbi:MAG: ABC transporter ATP-binding protein [Spirochaetaceae bacterium]|nr:ABC transporter ATP-binding protein [Spirochaetaceae bacterium]